jgi:hypothetical protein
MRSVTAISLPVSRKMSRGTIIETLPLSVEFTGVQSGERGRISAG